jgi:hypothetical protein
VGLVSAAGRVDLDPGVGVVASRRFVEGRADSVAGRGVIKAPSVFNSVDGDNVLGESAGDVEGRGVSRAALD